MSIDIDKINRLLPDGYSCEMRESPVRLTFTTPDDKQIRVVPDQWESEEDIVKQVLPPPGTLDLRKIQAGLPSKGFVVMRSEDRKRLIFSTPQGCFDVEPEEGDTEEDILHLLRTMVNDLSQTPVSTEEEVVKLKVEAYALRRRLDELESEIDFLKRRSR